MFLLDKVSAHLIHPLDVHKFHIPINQELHNLCLDGYYPTLLEESIISCSLESDASNILGVKATSEPSSKITFTLPSLSWDSLTFFFPIYIRICPSGHEASNYCRSYRPP